MMFKISLCVAMFAVTPVLAQDIIFIGETHDNPTHHLAQADLIRTIVPKAVVFEMLDEKQARAVNELTARDAAAIEKATDWEKSGWPDFAIYAPVFSALDHVPVYGAGVPREQARAVFDQGIAKTFSDAALFGLDHPLRPEDQKQAEDDEFSAHCNAIPRDILPQMVDIQRLRDATLAQATLNALREQGGPIVVITGNGHARRDTGAPSYVLRANPDVKIRVIGQGEAGEAPIGTFDEILDAPSVEREDPCAAFQK